MVLKKRDFVEEGAMASSFSFPLGSYKFLAPTHTHMHTHMHTHTHAYAHARTDGRKRAYWNEQTDRKKSCNGWSKSDEGEEAIFL